MSEVEVSEGIKHNSSTPAFRLVSFQNIPETYQFDQPVTCSFIVDPSFSPSAQDVVGLYKVGWMSVNDSVSVVHVDLPLKEEGSGTVTFNDVPKDTEEFYQFCYVGSSSHIHGASSPFQFFADDFEIIEDMPDVSLLECSTHCKEIRVEEEEKTFLERQVLERNRSDERPHDLEKRLSELTEENKKLMEELSSLKVELIKSKSPMEEEKKFVDGLEKLSLTGRSKDDFEGEVKVNATVATGFKETSQKEFLEGEKTLYPMETWFHNPYRHYIPANITDFSDVTVVTCELWPKNEIFRGSSQTLQATKATAAE